MKNNFRRFFRNFKPCIATHRGFGKHAGIPENTVKAFLASEKLGFKAHELDVRRTRDGQVVVFHGPRLENTTDGKGRVEDHSFAHIQTLNAAHYVLAKHTVRKPERTHVPTLTEVLLKTGKKTIINIELKRDRWDLSAGLERETVEIVREAKAEGRVFFSGFHFLTVWRLKRMKTGIPVGLLIEPGIFARSKFWFYSKILRPDNVHLHYTTASQSLVQKLKRDGYGLAFWTVNDINVAHQLFDWGADIVITDKMDFIKEFR